MKINWPSINLIYNTYYALKISQLWNEIHEKQCCVLTFHCCNVVMLNHSPRVHLQRDTAGVFLIIWPVYIYSAIFQHNIHCRCTVYSYLPLSYMVHCSIAPTCQNFLCLLLLTLWLKKESVLNTQRRVDKQTMNAFHKGQLKLASAQWSTVSTISSKHTYHTYRCMCRWICTI